MVRRALAKKIIVFLSLQTPASRVDRWNRFSLEPPMRHEAWVKRKREADPHVTLATHPPVVSFPKLGYMYNKTKPIALIGISEKYLKTYSNGPHHLPFLDQFCTMPRNVSKITLPVSFRLNLQQQSNHPLQKKFKIRRHIPQRTKKNTVHCENLKQPQHICACVRPSTPHPSPS